MAIGTKAFIEATVKKLGIRAKGRKVLSAGESYMLQEPPAAYAVNFALENDTLSHENSHFWRDIQ